MNVQDYRSLWIRIAAAILIAVTAWAVWAPTVRTMTARNPEWLDMHDELFEWGVVLPSAKVEFTGFHGCQFGFCLGPKSSGVLTYYFTARTEAQPQGYPILNIWFYRPEGGSNRASISYDGGRSFQPLAVEMQPHPRMTRLVLDNPVAQGQALAVRFEATNPGEDTQFVIDRFRVNYRRARVPDLPGPATVVGLFVSFGIAAVALCRRRTEAMATLLILALGAALRYVAAFEIADNLLESDARWYRIFAERMQLFGETGFFSARFDLREPFFIFVQHYFFRLVGGPSDWGAHLLGVILSVLSIYSMIALGRRMFGQIPGQLLGLAMALNTILVNEAPRGLRLELEIALLLLYLGLTFTKTWPRVLTQAAVTSFVGAVLVMTRWSYLPVVLILNAYALYRPEQLREWRSWRSWTLWRSQMPWIAGMAITVVILAAAVVPHRYNMYRVTGDAFYDTSRYARWNANVEFMGKPGFPTAEQMATGDTFMGPPITYRQYMALHTREDILIGTVRGYWKLFRAMQFCPWEVSSDIAVRARIDRVFQGLAILGFLLALLLPKYRWITLTFLLVEFPPAFLYDRALVEPYRHTYSAWPLVLFAAALPLVYTYDRLKQWRTPSPAIAQRSTYRGPTPP